jgi:hypothetical protein
MNIPCVILRGCLKGERVIQFVRENLSDMYDDTKRLAEISMAKGKPVRVYRWSWGVEIGCHEYRSKSTAWWDELLGMFGSTSDTPEIVILYNVDSLGGENQRVVRRHVEEDYKRVRYIMTCAKHAILDPSLESRCAVLVNNKGDIPSLPEIRTYKCAEELWLSDVHAGEILDTIFLQAIKTYTNEKELVQLWCWYSDVLKSCYQELTILECAFKDIKRVGVKR